MGCPVRCGCTGLPHLPRVCGTGLQLAGGYTDGIRPGLDHIFRSTLLGSG